MRGGRMAERPSGPGKAPVLRSLNQAHGMSPRPFLPKDEIAVERLLDAVFGPARQQRTAALLRRGSMWLPDLSFVVEDSAGAVTGTVQCWPLRWIRADGHARPLILLGPLVVDPLARGTRIGQELMQSACAALDREGRSAMLIGDAPYYGRFGFCSAATGHWQLPGPVDSNRLLLRSRTPTAFAAAARVLPAAAMLEQPPLRA